MKHEKKKILIIVMSARNVKKIIKFIAEDFFPVRTKEEKKFFRLCIS